MASITELMNLVSDDSRILTEISYLGRISVCVSLFKLFVNACIKKTYSLDSDRLNESKTKECMKNVTIDMNLIIRSSMKRVSLFIKKDTILVTDII